MVRSNICPRCLNDIESFYVEERDLIISDQKIVCPNCGFSFQGAINGCLNGEEVPNKKISTLTN